MKAFVLRNGGVVRVGDTVPEGALELADGPGHTLRFAVNATAQRVGDVVMVPGYQDAADDHAATAAVMDYRDALVTQLKTLALRRL